MEQPRCQEGITLKEEIEMNTSTFTSILFAGVLLFGLPLSVMAATDGQLGATSTGDLTITLDVGDEVLISNLADIALIESTPDNFVGTLSSICVYSNSATQGYNLTVTATGGSFGLVNGAAILSFGLEWIDDNAQTPFSGTPNIIYDVPLTGLTGDGSQDCQAGGKTAGIQVTASGSNLTAGQYSQTILLQIAPE